MVTGNDIMAMHNEVHQMLHEAVIKHRCEAGEAYKFVEGKKLKNGRTVRFYDTGGVLRAKFILEDPPK